MGEENLFSDEVGKCFTQRFMEGFGLEFRFTNNLIAFSFCGKSNYLIQSELKILVVLPKI